MAGHLLRHPHYSGADHCLQTGGFLWRSGGRMDSGNDQEPQEPQLSRYYLADFLAGSRGDLCLHCDCCPRQLPAVPPDGKMEKSFSAADHCSLLDQLPDPDLCVENLFAIQRDLSPSAGMVRHSGTDHQFALQRMGSADRDDLHLYPLRRSADLRRRGKI